MPHSTPTEAANPAADPESTAELTPQQWEMVTSNLGLAGAAARRYAARRGERLDFHDFEDLRSEGILGLIRAAGGFNEDGGAGFSTYGYIKARARVLDVIKADRALKRRAHAEAARYDPADLAEIVAAPDEAGDDAAAHIDMADRKAWLLAAIDRLPERSRAVIRGRLADESFQMIGRRLGISHNRARQIEARAHDHLRLMLSAGRGAGDVETRRFVREARDRGFGSRAIGAMLGIDPRVVRRIEREVAR